jgi:nitrate reductase cytochrome c-type subunit
MTAPDPTSRPRPDSETVNRVVHAFIGPVLLIVAAWLFVSRNWSELPHAEQVTVSREAFSTDPMREPLGDPPWIRSGGYQLSCMECHRLFVSPPVTPRRLMQHRHVTLEHGLNDQCLNCHDREDRNRLRLRTGETVPFAETPRLCGQCHGTAWRDWSRGTHGRTTDFWDSSRGTVRRLSCIECHDPHAPAFDPMVPLPGPNTLRMGDPHHGEHAGDSAKRNPLRQWSMHETAPRSAQEHEGHEAGEEESH